MQNVKESLLNISAFSLKTNTLNTIASIYIAFKQVETTFCELSM